MKPFRLVLTQEQTAALADGGPRFSVCIVHPGSWPDNAGRMLLDLIETDTRQWPATRSGQSYALSSRVAGCTTLTSPILRMRSLRRRTR